MEPALSFVVRALALPPSRPFEFVRRLSEGPQTGCWFLKRDPKRSAVRAPLPQRVEHCHARREQVGIGALAAQLLDRFLEELAGQGCLVSRDV
jgi:hypothetical protein